MKHVLKSTLKIVLMLTIAAVMVSVSVLYKPDPEKGYYNTYGDLIIDHQAEVSPSFDTHKQYHKPFWHKLSPEQQLALQLNEHVTIILPEE